MREDGEAPSDDEEGEASETESGDTSDGSDGSNGGRRREGKSRDEYVEVTADTPPALLYRYARGWQAYIVAVAR